MASFTSLLSSRPAPAVTVPSSPTERRANSSSKVMIAPSKPLSAARTFEPRPRTTQGTRSLSRTVTTRARPV